jgi:hypothetical protein
LSPPAERIAAMRLSRPVWGAGMELAIEGGGGGGGAGAPGGGGGGGEGVVLGG